jgi:hypothetical protein
MPHHRRRRRAKNPDQNWSGSVCLISGNGWCTGMMHPVLDSINSLSAAATLFRRTPRNYPPAEIIDVGGKNELATYLFAKAPF